MLCFPLLKSMASRFKHGPYFQIIIILSRRSPHRTVCRRCSVSCIRSRPANSTHETASAAAKSGFSFGKLTSRTSVLTLRGSTTFIGTRCATASFARQRSIPGVPRRGFNGRRRYLFKGQCIPLDAKASGSLTSLKLSSRRTKRKRAKLGARPPAAEIVGCRGCVLGKAVASHRTPIKV